MLAVLHIVLKLLAAIRPQKILTKLRAKKTKEKYYVGLTQHKDWDLIIVFCFRWFKSKIRERGTDKKYLITTQFCMHCNFFVNY